MILFCVFRSGPKTASCGLGVCLGPSSPLPRACFLHHLSKPGVTLTVPQRAPFIAFSWGLLAPLHSRQVSPQQPGEWGRGRERAAGWVGV